MFTYYILKAINYVFWAKVTVGKKDLYKTQPAHRIKSKEGDIQYEIMTDGPVQGILGFKSHLQYLKISASLNFFISV